MRRPWLLALLAAALVAPTAACDPNPDEPPTDAEAPTPQPGGITFPTVANTPIDGLINIAECEGGAIGFKAAFDAGSNPTSYQLYAANEDRTLDPDKPDECRTTVPATESTTYVARAVDVERNENIAGDLIAPDVTYSTSTIVAAAGFSCSAGDQIFLCLEARRGVSPVGSARVTLNLVVDKPGTPDLTGVRPGERGLNVQWDPDRPGVNEWYEVVTSTVDPLDPDVVGTQAAVRRSPPVTATEVRVGGLANGAEYLVYVVAHSDADNPSDPSNSITASPVAVSDFWEMYQDQPSPREQGGCGTGGSGAGALLGLAALAAIVGLRRRS